MKRKQLSASHFGVAKSRIYIVRSTSCISATAARSCGVRLSELDVGVWYPAGEEKEGHTLSGMDASISLFWLIASVYTRSWRVGWRDEKRNVSRADKVLLGL